MSMPKSSIGVMQKHLQVLRKISGWTAEDLGQRLGVTKQTISNLENRKVDMTKAQYMALRTIFEYEIRLTENNDVLKRVMYVLFYSQIDCLDEANKYITDALENLAAAAVGGITGSQLSLLSITLLSHANVINGVNIDRELNVQPYLWVKDLLEEDFE